MLKYGRCSEKVKQTCRGNASERVGKVKAPAAKLRDLDTHEEPTPESFPQTSTCAQWRPCVTFHPMNVITTVKTKTSQVAQRHTLVLSSPLKTYVAQMNSDGKHFSVGNEYLFLLNIKIRWRILNRAHRAQSGQRQWEWPCAVCTASEVATRDLNTFSATAAN